MGKRRKLTQADLEHLRQMEENAKRMRRLAEEAFVKLDPEQRKRVIEMAPSAAAFAEELTRREQQSA